MVSPNLYNMLLYRAFHARKNQCDLSEAKYQRPYSAFGRVPIVIYLGDFLQLKPTGSGISLLSDPLALEDQAGEGGPAAEHQTAMAQFCATPLCFELQEQQRCSSDAQPHQRCRVRRGGTPLRNVDQQ